MGGDPDIELKGFSTLEPFKVHKLINIAAKETQYGQSIELILKTPNTKNLIRTYVPSKQQVEFDEPAIAFFQSCITSAQNPFIVPLQKKFGRRLLMLPYGNYSMPDFPISCIKSRDSK